MPRHKNTIWNFNPEPKTWEEIQAALLMDIRDELQTLNSVMRCWETAEGFRSIRKLYKYTRQRWPLPKKKRKIK